MLWVMIRKECLNNLLELRFLVCGGLCIFLAVVSVVVLRADLAPKQADYHRNREIYRTEAEEYGGYENLAREGIRVDRPPQNYLHQTRSNRPVNEPFAVVVCDDETEVHGGCVLHAHGHDCAAGRSRERSSAAVASRMTVSSNPPRL